MIGTGTTWGLSGPTFLWLYAGLCALAAVTVRRQWQRALGPRPSSESAELDAYRLAIVNGGPQLAITAAAARLHDTGVLREGDTPHTLVVDGRLDRDADDLERAVFEAVQREPGIETSQLRRELRESAPIEHLTTRLTQVGLLLKPEVITSLSRLKFVGVALFLLGGARVWAGIDNDAPVAYLTIMVVAVAFATFLLPRRRPWATARGQALVATQRKNRSELRNGGSGLEMPLAVALFGGAALWAAEPAIASAWSVPRESGWATMSGSGGGGGCGGTTSWGGGGCGSSGGGDGGGGGGGGCGGGCGGGGS